MFCDYCFLSIFDASINFIFKVFSPHNKKEKKEKKTKKKQKHWIHGSIL